MLKLRSAISSSSCLSARECREHPKLIGVPYLPQLSNDSLNTFKSFFPARSASTGQELLLVKTPSGGLAVEFEGTLLGQLDDPGVMRDLFAGYVPSFPSLFFSVSTPTRRSAIQSRTCHLTSRSLSDLAGCSVMLVGPTGTSCQRTPTPRR
jgi:hypothetical protein